MLRTAHLHKELSASAAKQSILPHKERIDRLVARAPRAGERQIQTQLRDLAPGFARVLLVRSALSEQRAQGMPGARCARRRMCRWGQSWSAHALVGSRRNKPGIPHAMVTTACSPVGSRFPSVADRVASTDLTPTSGCQDHTLHPPQALSSKPPSASIAARSALMTFAQRPSVGTGWPTHSLICDFRKSEYFSRRGWTRTSFDSAGDLPAGQFSTCACYCESCCRWVRHYCDSKLDRRDAQLARYCVRDFGGRYGFRETFFKFS
jgi:hypothetical protein